MAEIIKLYVDYTNKSPCNMGCYFFFKFLSHHVDIFKAELCAIFTAVFAMRNSKKESYSYVLIHALPFVALKMIQVTFQW